MTRLVISPAQANGVATLALTGELDAHTAGELEAALQPHADTDVVLDMQGLSFVDSTGLRVVVSQHHKSEEAGKRLTLKNPSETVSKTLAYAGLAEHLNIG